MRKIVLACCLAVSTGATMAQTYVSARVGVTEFGIDCEGASTCDKSDAGYQFNVGYKFTPQVAAELGYVNFGKVHATGYLYGYVGGYYFYSPTYMTVDMDMTGWTAAVALRAPVSPVLSGVLRLGVATITVDSQVSLAGSARTVSETKANPYLGLGLEYAFSKNIKGTLSADFTQFQLSGQTGDVRMLSIGAQYDF